MLLKLQFMKIADQNTFHIYKKNIVIYKMFRMEGQCFAEELYDGSTFSSEKNNAKIKELREKFDDFKKRLNIFTKLKKHDKFGKDSENNLYIDYNKFGQYLSRWWYEQDRKKCNVILEEEFDLFVGFLDNVSTSLAETKINEFYILAQNCINFINKIITGLYSLKETYNNDNEMENRIDAIILTLIDFKNKTQRYDSVHINKN